MKIVQKGYSNRFAADELMSLHIDNLAKFRKANHFWRKIKEYASKILLKIIPQKYFNLRFSIIRFGSGPQSPLGWVSGYDY